MLANAHNLLLLAQEVEDHAPEEREGIDLVLPEPFELFWGAVAFAIVLFVLNRFAFPKIRQMIEDREKKIQSDLESAEKAKNEANAQLDEYKQQLAEARSEANRIIEDARQSGEQVRQDVIAKAERDAEAIVARAQQQIEAERNRTIQELQSTIADLSIELAEKVVGRSLDDSSQREFVDAYIREVGAMSGNGGGKG
jgi:F-type H+-transporting ATPase subunit b